MGGVDSVQQRRLSRALKMILKQQKIRYGTVAQWLHLSESSVKRLFSNESLTLEQIETICSCLHLDFVRLVLIANPEEQLPELLEAEQESELAASPELFRIFYLLFRQWKVSHIAEFWKIPTSRITQMLLELERLKLIDLLPENRVRLRVSQRLKWIPNGPIAQLFRADVTNSFLGEFNEKNPEHLLLFIPCELSKGGAKRIQKRISQLAFEIGELSEIEAQLHKSESQGHGILLALRPWVHPLFVP